MTMDAVALYLSILISDGIAAVLGLLQQQEQECDLLSLSIEEIKDLLAMILNSI